MSVANPTYADEGKAPFLPGYALFGALLACAGLPIYIHAPKFFVDQYGVGLAVLGAVLFGLRMIDFVQEPLLGWASDTIKRRKGAWIACCGLLMAGAMFCLFAVPAPIAPVWWFALTLTALFSSFSFLTISFYANGAVSGSQLGENGHVRLAAWRETGALLGVCAAAAAPTLFATVTTAPFTGFALAFALLALLALCTMRNAWDVKPDAAAKTDDVSFKQLLKDSVAKKLLIVALLNAAPVAVSSTVFLFYVESRLGLVGWEGGLLILFFLAAAAAAPIWARFAARFGAKPVLLCAMALAVAVFSLTLTLQEGDLFLFALICFASGATLGADMTLLPAIFSARLETIAIFRLPSRSIQ